MEYKTATARKEKKRKGKKEGKTEHRSFRDQKVRAPPAIANLSLGN